MKRHVLLAAAIAAALAVAAASAATGTPATHVATLSGAEEVPMNDSAGRGVGVAQFSSDGMSMSYRLNVANIENVTQAHIHLGQAGQNGPVVLWLYPDGPPAQLIPGRSDGPLAARTVTAADLVGLLAGQPLSALADEIRAGNAYVNVHTSQFPPGEIRGQLSDGPEAHGHD